MPNTVVAMELCTKKLRLLTLGWKKILPMATKPFWLFQSTPTIPKSELWLSLVISKVMYRRHAISHSPKCILTIGIPTKQVSIVYNKHLSSLVDYKLTRSIKIGPKLKQLETIVFSRMPWSTPDLATDGTDASAYVQDCVPLHTGKPSGYMEFDVTIAVKNWFAGDPNYGLLVWDVTENLDGRDIRFYSRESSDTNKRPFVNVFCATPCSTSSCRQRYPPPPVCPVPSNTARSTPE